MFVLYRFMMSAFTSTVQLNIILAKKTREKIKFSVDVHWHCESSKLLSIG